MGISEEIAKLKKEVAFITSMIENYEISGKKKTLYYKNLKKGLKWRQKKILKLKIMRRDLLVKVVEDYIEEKEYGHEFIQGLRSH